jgi:HAD superfamily hydrolase (TIGR01509 family)
MVFDAVVFDLDGVLVDSEHLWEENWVAYADGRGVRWNAEDTGAVQGMSAPEWAAYLARRCGTDQTAEQVETAVVDGVVAALRAGRAPLLHGARQTITVVSDRVPIALASSAARRVIDAILDIHGLTDRFAATVSSAEVPRGKPSPDVYLAAAGRVGADPKSCLGVEDSSNGIRAAAAAGLTVIALPNPTYPPKPDALDLAAVIAGSHDEVRTALLGYLTQPATVGEGERS